jgi:hypothetical protein
MIILHVRVLPFIVTYDNQQENTKIKTFLVDSTLPTTLFEALHRKDSGKKGKKGKKGGKKK